MRKFAYVLLGGKSPAGIVPEQTRNALMFDARQLKRWGISEATLPPDSIVRYRKLSVWQQYRWQAIGLIAFGLIQTLIIFLLWVQIKKRHHAETSARESEVKYRTVADFTYDWEYWANFDGKLHYVSPSCERISSYTAQEFIENPSLFREVIVPEDREIWDKHFQNSREELRQRELQFRIQRRDGKIRWIEHACQPVYDGQGNPSGFRASNRDITERKQSELALVESKTFNQTTLDSLKYHIAVLDQEGNVLDVNQSWLQFSHENDGGTSDRLGLGVNYLEVCRRSSIRGDDSAQAALEGIQSVIEGQSDHFELEYPCHSPTQKRWFLMRVTLFKGQQGRVIISHADITDRKLSEIDLQEAYTEIEQLKNQLEAETAYLQEEIKLEHDFESIIGNSPAIQHVLFKVEQVADTDTTVLVLGEDLFYRLNVFPITVPPLRDRIEDIPLLVEFFVEKASKRLGKSIKVVPTSVMNTLKKYPWPGNVRELENVIERAVISSSGPKLRLVDELSPVKPDFAAPLKTMEAVEYDHIVQVLERTEWKVSGKNGAAEILGLKRGTLRARMQKLGIRKP